MDAIPERRRHFSDATPDYKGLLPAIPCLFAGVSPRHTNDCLRANSIMLAKLILVLLLLAVIISLFTSLYFMFHDRGKSKRMVNTLMVRVILSFALIAYVVVAYLMGWLHPHGVGG